MAYKKTHPGLDQVVTDEAIEAFTAGTEPTLIEAPERRRWPVTVLTVVVTAAAGILTGFAAHEYLSAFQVMIIVGLGLGTAAAFFTVELGDDGG